MNDLKSILLTPKDVLTRWIEFRDGFSMQLRYLHKSEVVSMRERHTELKFNPISGFREPMVSSEALQKELVSTCVLAWKGLTFRILATLAPIDIKSIENMDAELPFSADNAVMLVQASPEMENFIGRHALNIEYFQSAKGVEGELKNSVSSQGGNSIPSESPANNATKSAESAS